MVRFLNICAMSSQSDLGHVPASYSDVEKVRSYSALAIVAFTKSVELLAARKKSLPSNLFAAGN